MRPQANLSVPVLICLYSFVGLILLSLIWGPSQQANADILQVSPLPTRITPTPTILPTVEPDDAGPASAGYIVLMLRGYAMPERMWTELEWQAASGRWNRIENGWQGHADVTGEVRWLVGEELLGDDTPFRWRVYTEEDGRLLAVSDAFEMPVRSGQTRFVVIDNPLEGRN